MSSPYRDELASLREENARLRAELATRPRTRPRMAMGLVALDFASIVLLRPWLNGGSEVKFWLGLAVVLGFATAAAASAFGYKRAT